MRKYNLVALLIVLGLVFITVGKADFKQWADFNIMIFGLFVAGNIIEHIYKK